MSRGSRPRAFSIPLDELNSRLDGIFGIKPPKQRYVPPPLPEDMQNTKSSFETQTGLSRAPPGRP